MKTTKVSNRSIAKMAVAMLSTIFMSVCYLTIGGINVAHAAVAELGATTIGQATDAADSGSDCAGATCWGWNATTKQLSIVDNAAALVSMNTTADTTVASDAEIVFLGATNGSLTLPAGRTLTIGDGTTATKLTIKGGQHFINNGTIVIKANATLEVRQDIATGATSDLGSLATSSTGSVTGPGTFLSKGAPNTSEVYEDVTINAEVLETISLGLSSAAVTIPAAVIGVNQNVAVSTTPLEARVSTNSVDGAKLMIRGISDAKGLTGQASGAETCRPGESGFAVTSLVLPTSAGCKAMATSRFALNAAPGADAIWGYYATTAANTAASTAGTPTAPALATKYANAVAAVDTAVMLEGADISGGVTQSNSIGWTGPVDENANGAMRAFFYFADQITASTVAGTYVGKVRITAVPSF